MSAHVPMSTTPDALYYAGTLVRLVRALDQQFFRRALLALG